MEINICVSCSECGKNLEIKDESGMKWVHGRASDIHEIIVEPCETCLERVREEERKKENE